MNAIVAGTIPSKFVTLDGLCYGIVKVAWTWFIPSKLVTLTWSIPSKADLVRRPGIGPMPPVRIYNYKRPTWRESEHFTWHEDSSGRWFIGQYSESAVLYYRRVIILQLSADAQFPFQINAVYFKQLPTLAIHININRKVKRFQQELWMRSLKAKWREQNSCSKRSNSQLNDKPWLKGKGWSMLCAFWFH